LDQVGLIARIVAGVVEIARGRKSWDTDGGEREGRISYHRGLDIAMTAFQEARTTGDPNSMLLVEYTFLNQELQFCDPTDTNAFSSLTAAIQSFDDAFLCLDVVSDVTVYRAAEKTHPHSAKYRIRGMPKDAFHIACIAHRTRIHNILRSPGINLTEKMVLQQRFACLFTAQQVYWARQQTALA
jgi:hypothetical protein